MRSTNGSDDCSIRSQRVIFATATDAPGGAVLTRPQHPSHLHATAALWALWAARERLAQAAAAEAREMLLTASDGLRSPVYGSRGSGGHSDPTASALLSGARPNLPAQLFARTNQTLWWLAGRLHATTGHDPLGRLSAALPTLRPTTAGEVCRWLTEADQRIRTHLQLAPDRQPLPGVACPSCAVRQMYVQTADPNRDRWTAICGDGCRCAGDDCPCAMPVRAAGVVHIWDRAALVTGPATTGLPT